MERYGSALFAICCEALYTGAIGRLQLTLPEGVKVRLKNKWASASASRPKYQAPHKEHPGTVQDIDDKQIHADHVEAFNSSSRRKLACFHRKANSYAKEKLPYSVG